MQTFFDELKNGTRNYRTVASLSGQITQEYRGRCVLELLQNAHDALGGAGPDDPRRIAFVLVTEPEPVLLIANSGRPFRQRDFKGICQLGQSPKDPNESVGNKGLGFQSVLEVSTRPQIWSTAAEEGDPEFVFGFDPAGTVRIVEQAVAEIESGFSTSHGVNLRRIINWSEEQLHDYQTRDRSGGAVDAAREARSYLSPYSIPLPIEETPPKVVELLGAGHVTVIRLRIDGGRTGAADKAIQPGSEDPDRATGTAADRLQARDEAVASLKDQLSRLVARSTVFLPDLEKLTIEIDGECRVLERIVDSTTDLPGTRPAREQVLLVGRSAGSAPNVATREFRVWTRSLGGEGDPVEAQRIQDAVKHLPNRWPEVRQVEVGVAVEDTESPEPGKFVIFLPTEVGTGTGAHINAPFYGSLDRRQINFEDEYNGLLLEYVMDLALDVAAELAAESSEGWRGRAVIDLLASAGTAPAGERPTLMDQIRQRAEETQRDLDKASLLLCDDGWRSASDARIMPDVPGDDPLGKDPWREVASFTVVSSQLEERHAEVEALLRCLGGSHKPTEAEWVATVEQLAARVHGGDVEASWDAFLRSLLAVLPQKLLSLRGMDTHPLAEAKFLPTQDGRLLSASDDNSARVFFQPRRGIDDAAEFVGRVPGSLQDRIAFLHDNVKTHRGPQRHNTDVQKFLDSRLVHSFRREDLLRDIVIPALPELPVPHGGSAATRCAEILGWTLTLIGNDVSETIADLLKRLPVACHGGWLAAGEAVFGPGWHDRHGASVRVLADSLTVGSSRLLEKTLLPPQDQRWGLDAAASDALLEQAGVIDGLPTEIADSASFTMSSTYRDLPRDAPPGTPQDAWDDWLGARGNEVTPVIKSRTSYRLDGIHLASEIHSLQDLPDKARNALSDLILASLGKWDPAWESARLARPRYPASARQITSPLKHWLTTLPWLHDNELDPRPLRDRWYVPESLLRGQGGRFAHLAPLSLTLAHRLGENPDLLATLRRLGLNVYPTEDDRTGPELLEALAAAHEENKMPAGGFDVFLGQVRHAWRHLDPDGELPERFLVRTKTRTLELRQASELADVYLPDHNTRNRSLREHRKPILEMRLAEAQGGAGDRLDTLDLRRASNLHERCLADGLPLIDDATAGAVSIEDTGLNWLPLVLLSLAAHGGANPRGPATDAWQNAMVRLRGALVRRCGSLAVELMDSDQIVARGEPHAHWLSDGGVLLLRHDAKYDELESASQAILERQDLLKDLRLVLGVLANAAPEPTRQQIESALDRADIDGEAVADIRHRWFGATTLLVDRIRPILKLLAVPQTGLDAAASDTQALRAWLALNLPEDAAKRWPPERLISAASRSRDDIEMGRAAFQNLGEIAQLPKWNDALAELGDRYPTVVNSEAADQAKRHIEEVAPSLQALARHIAIASAKPDLFRKLEEVRESFEAPADWSSRWWEAPFDAVLSELGTAWAGELGVDSGLVDALGGASKLERLRAALVQSGIDLDVDPYGTFRRNENWIESEIGQLHDLYRAWLVISGAAPAVTGSRAVESPLTDSSAYLQDWSETEIFVRALSVVGDADFRRRCENSVSVDEARAKLGVTPEAVARARWERSERREQAERKKRTFEIAGQPFMVEGAESYGDLLTRLDTLPVPKGPSVESDDSTRLIHPGPGPGPTPTQVPKASGKTSHLYASPHLPILVGIVGEMWAWRYLQSRFGRQVVTRAAWVSENGLKAQPLAGAEERDASDGHGFDFRFRSDGITWHFEVKATTEEATSFRLPPSEIRAATRLANSKCDRWRILRVRRALTDEPEIDLLPNPFETGSSDLFRLSSGGMTVRYALDADP